MFQTPETDNIDVTFWLLQNTFMHFKKVAVEVGETIDAWFDSRYFGSITVDRLIGGLAPCEPGLSRGVDSMMDAANNIRQRASMLGRRLPKRTVSTPLLLKSLEFDHVVVPDAKHFLGQRYAQAKLFYVAISRATHTLTISSSSRFIQFPKPII